MERYSQNKKRRDSETSRVFYSTIIYPKIDRNVDDVYIMARYGDRLDNLAYEYYRDVTLWWIIAQANGLGHGTMGVSPGKQIRIPMDTDKILNDFDNIVNSRRVT